VETLLYAPALVLVARSVAGQLSMPLPSSEPSSCLVWCSPLPRQFHPLMQCRTLQTRGKQQERCAAAGSALLLLLLLMLLLCSAGAFVAAAAAAAAVVAAAPRPGDYVKGLSRER
jgi:hypothetical protein